MRRRKAIREDRAPSYFFLHYDITGRAALPRSLAEQQLGPTNEIWLVRNLLLVPSFAFPPSAIIQCPPLSPTARRAGWVGCNFDLSRVPAEARIWLVTTSGQSRAGVSPAQRARQREQSTGFADAGRRDACPTLIATPSEVLEKFKRVKPLKELSVMERGWTLDVLNIVRRISEGRVIRVPNISEKSGTQLGTRGTRPSGEFTNEDVYAFDRELEQLHPDNRHVWDKIRQQLQVLRDAKLLIHVSIGVWKLP